VELQHLSMPLSTYIVSSKGGDKTLLAPWAVRFGKTAGELDMAVATDLTERVRFFVQAIQVPGAKPAELTGEFAKLARQASWPVTGRTVASRPVLEITDPVAEAAGGLATAYVFAVGDVMYIVVTDETSLLVEALIKLPE
jgi:protein involved in polysaccharide export with SLBB domain